MSSQFFSILMLIIPIVHFLQKNVSQTADDPVPQPVVLIDQDSDRDATIVQLSFGDRLGALLDTVCIFLCRGFLLLGLPCLRYVFMIFKL
jgi:hypothetical protein